MFGMSFGELVVVIVLAIVVIGPKDLPKILRKLGQWSGKLRRMALDLRAQSGIDEVLREGSIASDIAEIRKLTRGELQNVMKGATVEPDGAAATAAATAVASSYSGSSSYSSSYSSESHGYGLPSDYDEVEEAILRDREYPREGADSYGALHDTAVVYTDSLPASLLATNALYTTGVEGPDVEPPVAKDAALHEGASHEPTAHMPAPNTTETAETTGTTTGTTTEPNDRGDDAPHASPQDGPTASAEPGDTDGGSGANASPSEPS